MSKQDASLSNPLLKGGAPASNVFESTVERIRRSIRIGLLKPGDQLPPERELAELTSVSRTTVRAAIKVLVEAGFLEVRRGRTGGTFVSEAAGWQEDEPVDGAVSDVEVQELLERRYILETGIVELAARRVTDEQLASLRLLVGRMMEQVDDRDAFRDIDVQFHLKLAEITRNDWLVHQTAELQADFSHLIELIPPSRDALTNSNAQHARVVAFLARRDSEGARREMAEHLGGTERMLHGLLPGD